MTDSVTPGDELTKLDEQDSNPKNDMYIIEYKSPIYSHKKRHEATVIISFYT